MQVESHPYYTGIETALSADTTEPSAATLTDCRIYADVLPNDPELPAIRIALINDETHQRLGATDDSTGDVQIDVYCKPKQEALAFQIGREVRSVLDRQNIVVDGYSRVHCVCTRRPTPMVEMGYSRVHSRYRLFGNES